MLIEYLFELNPINILILSITIIVFAYKTLKPNKIAIEKLSEVDFPKHKFISLNQENTDFKKEISVISYNILANNFVKPSFFSHCNPEYLKAKYRAPKVLQEIKNIDADVICLQECDFDLFLEFYKPNFEALGYGVLINIANINKLVTVAILYKKSRLSLVDKYYLDLNEGLDKLHDSFSKHKEALFAKLKIIDTDKTIIVANTHLFWNPEFEYVKYGQISKIVMYIQKNFSDFPVILGGDLNSLPSSNVMRYFYNLSPIINSSTKGDYSLNKKFMEKFSTENRHNLIFSSIFNNYKKVLHNTSNTNRNSLNENDGLVSEDKFKLFCENHPDFTNTNYSDEFCGCLDYILYSSDKLKLSSIMEVEACNDIKILKLPSANYPSDHLMIGAKFVV